MIGSTLTTINGSFNPHGINLIAWFIQLFFEKHENGGESIVRHCLTLAWTNYEFLSHNGFRNLIAVRHIPSNYAVVSKLTHWHLRRRNASLLPQITGETAPDRQCCPGMRGSRSQDYGHRR